MRIFLDTTFLWRRRGLVALFFAAVVTCSFASTVSAATKKIVFLAGPRDHGMSGRHEYERDLKTLAQSLEHASNVSGVTTEL
ncbi:MAG TPA: hypothetical protein VFS24_16135, partial [Steroidobacteraceae bacterium]|nr:hypothetical protein [Steroidobacteraceae bacterium]